MMLFSFTAATASPADDRHIQPSHDDIVDVAVKAGTFDTLIAAVKAAGLVETLKGDGPFTVFAPTDEAFAKLPAGAVENLLKPENKEQLIAILTFHVVPGKIRSEDLLNVTQAETIAGKPVSIGLRVGEATVIQADIGASNGVIHVIDTVLMPQMELSSMSKAQELIRMAIERGAPLYNQGQASACASIYEVTAKALLDLEEELPASTQRSLRQALQQMDHTHDPNERAWIMRKGLDAAYTSLSSRPMMTTVTSHN